MNDGVGCTPNRGPWPRCGTVVEEGGGDAGGSNGSRPDGERRLVGGEGGGRGRWYGCCSIIDGVGCTPDTG